MKVPENSDRHHKYITRKIDFPFNSLQNGSGICKPMAPAILQKYLCSPHLILQFTWHSWKLRSSLEENHYQQWHHICFWQQIVQCATILSGRKFCLLH
ncbi:hypothetical protein LOK49_Contig256G00001 [Camellia lanceoleosa]|nr:hypothetical protein LOK49_Contig256G00001 [Camellia lanceoleosa]